MRNARAACPRVHRPEFPNWPFGLMLISSQEIRRENLPPFAGDVEGRVRARAVQRDDVRREYRLPAVTTTWRAGLRRDFIQNLIQLEIGPIRGSPRSVRGYRTTRQRQIAPVVRMNPERHATRTNTSLNRVKHLSDLNARLVEACCAAAGRVVATARTPSSAADRRA